MNRTGRKGHRGNKETHRRRLHTGRRDTRIGGQYCPG
jgi:hypothetical protein